VDLEISHTWVLRSGGSRGALHVTTRRDLSYSQSMALLRGESTPTSPVVLGYHSGSKARDFVSCSLVAIRVISSRVATLFADAGFTGWCTFPITLSHKDGMPIEGYAGLSVTGSCGPIDNSKSRLEWFDAPCEGGQRHRRRLGLFPEPDSWDGSDLFVAEGTATIFVVDAVKRALEKAKITNIKFERAVDAYNPPP